MVKQNSFKVWIIGSIPIRHIMCLFSLGKIPSSFLKENILVVVERLTSICWFDSNIFRFWKIGEMVYAKVCKTFIRKFSLFSYSLIFYIYINSSGLRVTSFIFKRYGFFWKLLMLILCFILTGSGAEVAHQTHTVEIPKKD